jgi:hypothetical protein
LSSNKDLEDKVINQLPELLDKCQADFDLISSLIDLTNILAGKSDENKDKLVAKDILKPTGEFL